MGFDKPVFVGHGRLPTEPPHQKLLTSFDKTNAPGSFGRLTIQADGR